MTSVLTLTLFFSPFFFLFSFFILPATAVIKLVTMKKKKHEKWRMAQVERAVARALVLAHINFFSCLFLHLLPSSTVTVLYYSFSSFILFTNSPSFLLLIRINLYSFISRSFKSILKRNIKDVPNSFVLLQVTVNKQDWHLDIF
jgi:hypothetical protein